MSRFKEGNRIESAIKHKDHKELLWALEYCQNRLSSSTMKQHIKHWNKYIKSINNTISHVADGE